MGDGGSGAHPSLTYLARWKECVERGLLQIVRRLGRPGLALSGPRTVFIMNEKLFHSSLLAVLSLPAREDGETDLV